MKQSFHHCSFNKKRTAVYTKQAHAYTTKLLKIEKKRDYTRHETSLYVAGDEVYQKSLKKALKSFHGIQHVVLIGIGGSSLGTEAVYRALAWKTSASLLVIDSIDREALQTLEQLVTTVADPSSIALIVVSKSGTTTETMLNAGKALEVCEATYGDSFLKQVIFIGDKDTPFFKIGKKKKILCLPMPHIIGGRYSLFTAVGMVPLMLLGIDTVSLREGALAAITKKEMEHREASAVTLALHAEQGTHTVNFFTFNTRLEYCGLWYRQLLAESIGKNMTTKGTTFSHHLLPIVSTSVDLHSMAQLYLGGYTNMYTHFVYYNEHQPFHVLSNNWLLEHVPFLREKNSAEVEKAIRSGVFKAYDDQKLPYQYTELQKCSAYEVGYLLNALMCEVMCLAHLLHVDPFNQPSVELYKKHTRVILNT